MAWFTKHADRLRRAAVLTQDDNLREWFTSTADDLEARRPVVCLDEVMVCADAVVTVRQP